MPWVLFAPERRAAISIAVPVPAINKPTGPVRGKIKTVKKRRTSEEKFPVTQFLNFSDSNSYVYNS